MTPLAFQTAVVLTVYLKIVQCSFIESSASTVLNGEVNNE